MALWDRLIQHPGFEKIKSSLYNDQFPLEVRFVCAHWIEERVKADQFVDINDPMIDQRAGNFIHALIAELETEQVKLTSAQNPSIKFRIDQAIRTYNQCLYSPLATYKQIRDAILFEQHFVSNEDQGHQYLDQEASEINDKLAQLATMTARNNDVYTRYKHELEQYKMVDYAETSKHLQQLNNLPNTPDMEERRLIMIEDHKQKRMVMLDSINCNAVEQFQAIRQVIQELDNVQKVVILKRLGKWQRDQALSGNGSPVLMSTLDEIQVWFEKLAECIWNTRNLVDKMKNTNQHFSLNLGDHMDVAYKEITHLLQNLIVSGFIVEKQPPQVMKTNTR